MADDGPTASGLLEIIAFARLGATDHAWALLNARGVDREGDDPAALSVLGRLLKDRALAARGAERTRLYGEAANAYARAAELEPAIYPQINAATLALLAGQPERSRRLAGGILELIAASPEHGETPYYREATVAEALLLLGDKAAAETSLSLAIAREPRAWEDHASTLRQFELILDGLGVERDWLDVYRPPRSLHFAGHLRLAPTDPVLAERITRLIAEERIGFAWGALAAGADILVAEALVAAGVELNLVLPAPRDIFRDMSVAPLGDNWVDRYERLAEQAATVRILEVATLSTAAVTLADMRAMGAAVMHADLLRSEAVQLLVVGDSPAVGEGDQTERAARLWHDAGRRQHRFTALAGSRPATAPAQTGAKVWRTAATIAVDPFFGEIDDVDDGSADHIVVALATTLSGCSGLVEAPRWAGGLLHAMFDRPDAAAQAIMAIIAALPATARFRIAADFGVVRMTGAAAGAVPLGAVARLATRMLGSVPQGAAYVTEPFAAALTAIARRPPAMQWIGELEGGAVGAAIPLYVLKPASANDLHTIMS